jgi:sigma-54 specific flagellar transcriptional regulator A
MFQLRNIGELCNRPGLVFVHNPNHNSIRHRGHFQNMRQPSPIIGNSQPMCAIRQLIDTIADSTATVLISGESGTGKELVAQALHKQSCRAEANFVPLNCAAIPKDLMESELFGHRKGAFTGALADRVGRFELAHGGTLFLDEIGDLSLDMQVKLLRVLQERMVDPVGSSRPVSVDVRVVAATHRDLEVEIAEGRFREDLYYRLNVLPVTTPPLRERGDDIALLIKYYAERFAQKNVPITFTPDFLNALKAYNWPGNVRELSNLVHRFSTLFAGQRLSLHVMPAPMLPKGLVKIQDEQRSLQPDIAAELATLPADDHEPHAADVLHMFPQEEPASMPLAALASESSERNHVEDIILLAQGISTLPPDGVSLKERMAQIERAFIEQALDRADGNVSKTARMLNLQRTTLIEKIDKYRLRSV